MTRVLLSGYYGFGNLGDEALLEITVGELRRRHPSMELEVLSQTPKATAERYAVEATPRMDLAAVRGAIGRADLLLSGGGGLLQNATSTRSLIYYAGILRAGVQAHKRTMVFAQSIGPLDLVGRLIVREFCRGVDRATVRDEASRALLARVLPKVPIERTADLVWMLDATNGANPLDLAAEGLGPDSDPLALISVRKIPSFERGIRVLAAAADRLAERGAKVAFLPLGGAPDAEASTAVIRICKSAPTLLPAYELGKAAQVVARAHVVIGMRLHALILAARFGIPFLAIPYDPKVVALCDELGWPLPPLWEPLQRGSGGDLGQAGALVDRLWDERESLRTRLLPHIERMQTLAARNFTVIDEILGL